MKQEVFTQPAVATLHWSKCHNIEIFLYRISS